MQDKTKNMIITVGFAFILMLVFVVNLISEDKKISEAERRTLAQFPKITLAGLTSGDVIDKFDDYAVDQFVGRDFFRGIKALNNMYIFNQKDNNKLFEKDGAIYKMEYPLNKNNVQKSAKKIYDIYQKHMKDMNVYYAIIPDKIHYLTDNDHLKLDHNELKNIMQNQLRNMKYIDIWNNLKLEDYYKTDIHWRQENLQNVVSKLQQGMNLQNTSSTTYEKIDAGDFYGTYYGQLGVSAEPDKIYILRNDVIDNAITYNYETSKNGKIYVEPKSADKYDIYLEGATPLISIENPNANTNKELLLFRDSFGSSIAPLLVENYKKITLIDIRYMSSTLLEQYIDFENQDVLFLYSALVLNQNIFK